MYKIKLPLFLLFMIISSCVSKKEIIYFQKDKINQLLVSNSYKTIFKPDDLLQITITGLDIEAVRPFNLAAVTYATSSNSAIGVAQQQSYLVDTKGEIEFPVLGTVKIGGLTREEAIKMLKSKLSPDYIKEPNINIKIANYKITVLGDVGRAGSYNIQNERITILEAIGLAGDLNLSGNRSNVKVHREENGKKIEYTVDLLSKNTFTSPVYYLQQNDVVYVSQNYAKIQSASSNSNTTLFISITGLFITIVSLLTR